ncbi:RcpC/CpaB family pilus assembly protein [Streptomyces sp. NPDC127108]|uniref:RcpC/CpaB family pilus assembly protein n=1 Tax=Streptomyces sp. NPDC127108 TaxID=3345361 RepID=UPI00363F2C05
MPQVPSRTHTSPPGRGSGAPPPCQVPHFSPLHVRGGRQRLRRLLRHRRRALAVGLAMTAAALVTAGPREPERPQPQGSAAPVTAGEHGDDPAPHRTRRAARLVTAPVRIADAATVRLLRPGDRVDVVAAGGAEVDGTGAGAASARPGGEARVVAVGARVSEVPDSPDAVAEGGALVVLAVPRATAARLAGASATARLAVTLR